MFCMMHPSHAMEVLTENMSALQDALVEASAPLPQACPRTAELQRLEEQVCPRTAPAPLVAGLPSDGIQGPADDIHAADDAQKDLRYKLLSHKLQGGRAWAPRTLGTPKQQTLTIFDWDDTLLCTTWLKQQNYQPIATDDEPLRKIVRHSKSMLETAIRCGETYIITNAMSGWVEFTAARWAPELLPVLRQVQIISARDRFQAAFPGDIGQWKIQAFLDLQKQLDSTVITNLVVLGDADYEMEAARIMGDQLEEGLVKTIKFRPRPFLLEHLSELEVVSRNLEKMIRSVRNLKVSLSSKK